MVMAKKYSTILAFLLLLVVASAASAQNKKRYKFVNGEWVEIVQRPAAPQKLEADTTLDVSSQVFPPYFYTPAVFDSYDIHVEPPKISTFGRGDSIMRWVNDRVALDNRMRYTRQRFMVDHPGDVRYNINDLPEAPKRYRAYVDPATARINVEEISVDKKDVVNDVKPLEVKRKNWIHDFTGLVQFSQAYNSPNWYQGGNNNLNAIVNGVYNVKLNQTFHPNLLFENTIQYKLAMNSAPDDSLRNYSISEDLLQINSKFGIKARKSWYYSATLQFKTQLLNNYKKNTRDMQASFLSPGELNIGLGMTYSYENPKKNFTVNASLAPLSYNLKTCINNKIDETTMSIKAGRNIANQFGSNIDCKMVWQIAYNIKLTSTLTAFTDYSYIQGDWENTLAFTINRFLSTQIYVHLRYDSTTARADDSAWHKWQLKEVLSFGFSYTIGTV